MLIRTPQVPFESANLGRVNARFEPQSSHVGPRRSVCLMHAAAGASHFVFQGLTRKGGTRRPDWEQSCPMDLTDEGLLADLEDHKAKHGSKAS
jgi:hypothetical protein